MSRARRFFVGRTRLIVDEGNHCTVVSLPDSRQMLVPWAAKPGDLERSRDLGYLNPVAMNRDHDICHALVAELLGLPESPVLAYAARALPRSQAPSTWRLEEGLVFALQSYLGHARVSVYDLLSRYEVADRGGERPERQSQQLVLVAPGAAESREPIRQGDILRVKKRGEDGAIFLEGYSAPQPSVSPETIVCDVLTMQHSSGFPDHFTRVRVGGRELTLFMSKIRGRCEYHAAELDWLLNGAEKPHILDFPDEEPEGLSEYLRSVGTPPPPSRLADLDKATKQKLREALRFSASRSVLSAEDERRILSALEEPSQ